jgi:hypothetical protein
MKILFTLLGYTLFFSLNAQTTFWTENFGTGCNRGQVPSSYSGVNGSWSVSASGPNEANPNAWYISGTAAGTSAGTCNSNCLLASTSNQSLHIGNPEVDLSSFGIHIFPDTGSTYLTGFYCGAGICSITNSRAESPLINCTGYSSVTIAFTYYENGENTLDDATLQYSSDGGGAWTMINAIPKTTGACASMIGGTWNSFAAFALPISADNNPNVKIAFNWTNNGSGGSDPSFAVDDIVIAGIGAGGPAITTQPVGTSFCAGDSVAVDYSITGTFTTGNIFTAQLSDASGSFASPTTIGTLSSTSSGSIFSLIPAGTLSGTGYMIRVVSSTPAITGSSIGPVTINALPTPTANNTGPYCAGATIQLNSPTGSATDDWTGPNSYSQSNIQNPTILSSVVLMSGVYTVTVTNGSGCSATATTTVVVLDCSGIENSELDQVSVYPNPTSDVFTISIPDAMVNETGISIINMVGQQVYSANATQAKINFGTQSLGLKPGIYLIQLKYNNQTKVVRLIVR